MGHRYEGIRAILRTARKLFKDATRTEFWDRLVRFLLLKERCLREWQAWLDAHEGWTLPPDAWRSAEDLARERWEDQVTFTDAQLLEIHRPEDREANDFESCVEDPEVGLSRSLSRQLICFMTVKKELLRLAEDLGRLLVP